MVVVRVKELAPSFPRLRGYHRLVDLTLCCKNCWFIPAAGVHVTASCLLPGVIWTLVGAWSAFAGAAANSMSAPASAAPRVRTARARYCAEPTQPRLAACGG